MVDQEIERALEAFERGHASGATSEELVALLRKLGERFTESTLRKYVQLGLLPRSRRVGAKGKHQGSWGVYPAWTARQVMGIKTMLSGGRTIDDIAHGMFGLIADCMGIATDLVMVRERLDRLDGEPGSDHEAIDGMRGLIVEAAMDVERAAGMARGGRKAVEVAI